MPSQLRAFTRTTFDGGIDAVSSPYKVSPKHVLRANNLLLDEAGAMAVRDGVTTIDQAPETVDSIRGLPTLVMLDGSLQLLDSTGNVLGSAATPSLSESLAMDLGPGSYALQVLSAGNYGDIGQYTLSGTVVPEPGMLALILPGLLALRRRSRN